MILEWFVAVVVLAALIAAAWAFYCYKPGKKAADPEVPHGEHKSTREHPHAAHHNRRA
jgi:hypothetical protein